MLLSLGTLELEIITRTQAVFMKVGRLELVVEREGKQPCNAKWFDVWKEPRGYRGGHYNSAHYFGFGRRLFWSRVAN